MAIKIADVFDLKPDELFYNDFKNKGIITLFLKFYFVIIIFYIFS